MTGQGKRLRTLLLALLLVLGLSAPGLAAGGRADVTILYTNDVHSYLDQDLTYGRIAAYRNSLDNVLLVDAGDQTQGTAYGSMDQGASVVSLMNAAGYDLATLGNHEFDYGMEGCLATVERAEFPYVSCNFYHEEDGVPGDNVLESFRVFQCGGISVAFIGITTPESFTKSTPAYFQDAEGNYICGIAGGDDGAALYEAVQEAIDQASAQADVVIALGHLGDDISSQPWTSLEVIANTTGLDAFIDGHSHSTVPMREVSDREGNAVVLTQTGNYLSALGQMTIAADGTITTELLTAEDLAEVQPDEAVQSLEESWIAQVDQMLGEKVASSEIHFTINFPDSEERAVRMAETNLGDFNADAYYWYVNQKAGLEADAAIVNGGGIRAGVEPGDWSYLTCKTVNTFGNVLCVVRVTGQTILDALEFGARYVGLVDETTGASTENGGFLHTAGLTYEIQTGVENTVREDEKGIWREGPETYRVTNVQVYDRESGSWVPLEPDRYYTVTGANYTLLNCGDGFAMFQGAAKVLDGAAEDYLALAAYAAAFTDSDGDGSPDLTSANSPLASWPGYRLNYEDPAGAGRITVKEQSGEEDAPEDPGGSACYVVVPGDSLWRIAARYYGSGYRWELIYQANRDVIRNPNLIYPGQKLVLPAA